MKGWSRRAEAAQVGDGGSPEVASSVVLPGAYIFTTSVPFGFGQVRLTSVSCNLSVPTYPLPSLYTRISPPVLVQAGGPALARPCSL